MNKLFIFVTEKFKDKHDKDKKYYKDRNPCQYTGKYRNAPHSISNLKYNVPREVPIFFSNGCNYDYHFIMKEQINLKNSLLFQEKIVKNT